MSGCIVSRLSGHPIVNHTLGISPLPRFRACGSRSSISNHAHFMSDSVNGCDNFMLNASLFNHVLQNLKLSPPWWSIDNGGVAQQW
jgi:hypothetical protein